MRSEYSVPYVHHIKEIACSPILPHRRHAAFVALTISVVLMTSLDAASIEFETQRLWSTSVSV
jgi:hypothetical protein